MLKNTDMLTVQSTGQTDHVDKKCPVYWTVIVTTFLNILIWGNFCRPIFKKIQKINISMVALLFAI